MVQPPNDKEEVPHKLQTDNKKLLQLRILQK